MFDFFKDLLKSRMDFFWTPFWFDWCLAVIIAVSAMVTSFYTDNQAITILVVVLVALIFSISCGIFQKILVKKNKERLIDFPGYHVLNIVLILFIIVVVCTFKHTGDGSVCYPLPIQIHF